MEGFGWLTRVYEGRTITGAKITTSGVTAREKLNQLLPDVREDAQAQEEESSSSSSSSSRSEEEEATKRRKVVAEEEEEEEEVSDIEEDLDLAFDLDPENKEDRELIASMFKEEGALKRGKKHVAINIKILKALNSADGTLPLTEIEFEATRRNSYMRTLQGWGWIDVASVIKNKNQYKIKDLGIQALKALIAYKADEITEDTLYPFFQKPQAKKKRKSRSLRNVDEEEYVDEEEGYEDEEEVIVPTSNSQQKRLGSKEKRRKKSKIPEEEENDDLGDKDMDIEVEEAGNPEGQGMEVEEEEDEIVQGGGLNPQQLFDGVHNEQVEGFILNTILRGEVLPQVQKDGDLLKQMRQAALGILTPKLEELMRLQEIKPGDAFSPYVDSQFTFSWKLGGE